MEETKTIDLRPQDFEIVRKILKEHLPQGTKVYVFGSRATGKARRGSDLDLALDLGGKMEYRLKSRIALAFQDSDLPYMVDLMDLHTVNPNLKQIITPDFLALDWDVIPG